VRRFSRAAAIMFIAAMSVAVAAIAFVAQTTRSAHHHAEILSALDQLVAAETSLDRDLLEIVAGLLPHYDTVVDLSRTLDEVYAAIAGDDDDFSADLRDEYRRQLEEKRLSAEQIKGLSAFVANEESYLPFEVERYARSAPVDVVQSLQHLLIIHLGDHARGAPLSASNETLMRLQDRRGDAALTNILVHFHLLREQHSRLHEAIDGYLAIASHAAVERLRGHYMKIYNARQAQALLITQGLTALTIGLFVGLGWTMSRLGRAHGSAECARVRLLDAVTSLPEGFALFDSADRMVLANPSYEALMGEALMGEDDCQGYGGLIAALQAQGGAGNLSPAVINQEQIIQSGDRWLLFRSRATAEAGVVCLLMDLTDHKRMEDELHKLSAVVEQSPLSIMITDERGLIEYVNPSFMALTGYDAAEVIGQNPRVLKSGETPSETFSEMWKTISAGMMWRGEVINRKKSGENFVENTLVFPIHGQNDRVRHYIALKENVTLLRKNANLVVDARADMERLLFAASHDLQEPIRDIILHIQLLERRLGDAGGDEVAECLHIIRRSGQQLRLLVKGLLDYNRSNRSLSTLGAVNCGLIVERAISEIAPAEGDSGPRFTVGPLPIVQGDPVLLSILFENLIGNAVKYSQTEASSQVSISAYVEDGGWRIDVIDNGIGIEPQYLKTIIRPFSRLHSRADFPGAGLGLAAAAKIAALHDGRLWLTSEFGTGTTAHLWLPGGVAPAC
jgi:PAS domain S-box-containing protein